MALSNYIPDKNPFRLSGPPQWWLRRLWDFDSSLVVVPSRQECVYRLAQRRKLQLQENLVNDILFQDSDTQMLARHGLVPVTTIIATANWDNPYMFVELANRAPWRMGGAEAVNARLEQEEMEADAKLQAQTDEHLDYLSKDAWKLYRKKIGLGRTMFHSIPGSKTPTLFGVT